MTGLYNCPKCGSDNVCVYAFDISSSVVAMCEDCKYCLVIDVPWEDMTIEEHDEVGHEIIAEQWNEINEVEK